MLIEGSMKPTQPSPSKRSLGCLQCQRSFYWDRISIAIRLKSHVSPRSLEPIGSSELGISACTTVVWLRNSQGLIRALFLGGGLRFPWVLGAVFFWGGGPRTPSSFLYLLDTNSQDVRDGVLNYRWISLETHVNPWDIYQRPDCWSIKNMFHLWY